MAAKLILHSHKLAVAYDCLASTGILTLEPGSINTVPGSVNFSLDLRCKEDGRLMRFEDQLKKDFAKLKEGGDIRGSNARTVAGKRCTITWRLHSPSSAVEFNKDCIECVARAARVLFGRDADRVTQRMISGAGKHTSSMT